MAANERTERAKVIVSRIFARLQGIYGSTFTGKFSTGVSHQTGIDSGWENAKIVWAEELDGFIENLDAIAYALKNVDPRFAPSSREFLALCRHAPTKEAPKIEHRLTPEEQQRADEAARKLAQQAKEATRLTDTRDHKAWAKAINKRFLNGDKTLNHIALGKAKEALGTGWRAQA